MNRGSYHLLLFAVLLLPSSSWAQEDVEPIDALLERYLSESDHSGHLLIAAELQKRGAPLQKAIEDRLTAFESGTDPYSPEVIGETGNQRNLTPGGALYQLGLLANKVDDVRFSHTYWTRAMTQVLERNLDRWSEATIADEFIKRANTDDLPMLKQIVQAESTFMPAVSNLAKDAIARIARDRHGSGSPIPLDTPPTPTPAPLTETQTPAQPDAKNPNSLLFVILGLLVVAVAVVALRKIRRG